MSGKLESQPAVTPVRRHPFWRSVLRGLGVVLPPFLTVVIFVWLLGTIDRNVLRPVASGARDMLAWYLVQQIPDDLEGANPVVDGVAYRELAPHSYIPQEVYDAVRVDPATGTRPATQVAYYQLFVEQRYMQPYVVIPVVLCGFILVVYVIGRLLAAGIGRVLWNIFELGIGRLPLVRTVYSAVKQVTDFMFSETEVQFTRVVAVEYPRKGIWSLGLVTGDSLGDLHDDVQEPLVSVLLPASPMPVTGYTITFKKSETIDLDITIDQALQFIVSCGVVVPPHQMTAPASSFEGWPADQQLEAGGGARG